MIRLSKKFVLLVLVFVLFLVFYAVYAKENQKVKVIFLNVGQGDGQLVLLPGDVQILIDAGPAEKISGSLSQHMPFYDKDIELAILTHPHADHLRGFISVFKDYKIKNFMFSGANYESKIYADFLELLKIEGSRVYLARAGDTVNFVKHQVSDKNVQHSVLNILSPVRETLTQGFKSIHESMVVSQLNLADKKFLLMGDAEEELERELVTSNAIQNIDVLKIGHHGSKTSTSKVLLESARPEEAIIQVGRNSYGHPAPLVLDRLTEFGVKVFRNDELGDIVYE